MAADIVKGADNAVFTEYKQNGKASNLKGDVVSGLVEAATMSNAYPGLPA